MGHHDEELRSLAAGAATGDLGAAEVLFRDMHGPLMCFLHVLGVRPDVVDEIAQDVALEVHRALGQYDASKPFLPWMRGVARHVVARANRHAAREHSRRSALRAFVEQRWSEQRDPDWMDLERLAQCVAKLPDHPQHMIRMHYFEGMRCEGIAQRLRTTAAAVRKALSRSRATLRGCIDPARNSNETGSA